jgi:hypothetical protein
VFGGGQVKELLKIGKNNGDNVHDVGKLTLLMSIILISFVAQHQAVLIFGAMFCATYSLIKNWPLQIKNKHWVFFLFVSALFMPAFMKPYNGLSPIFYIISTISVFFAAQAASRYNPEIFLTSFRIIFLLSIIAISIILYAYWGHPEPFGMVIEGSSTNGIPAYLIVIQIGLSLSNFLTNRPLPVLSVIATGAVAFFGNGRGSLVVAGAMIVASLLLNLIIIGQRTKKERIIYIVFLMVVLIPFVANYDELMDLLISYTKLSVGLDDSNRIEILGDYISKINIYTFLIGADYSNTVIEYKMLGNPHIAYIRTHSFFGIFVAIMAIISPVFVFFSLKKLSAKIIFSIFIGFAAMRATSEPIFFPTLLDFFYFLYFFLFYRYADDKNNISKT